MVKGTSVLFSIEVVPVYIPTNRGRGFPFLHTLSPFIVYRFSDNGHSDRCEGISPCSFGFHFSNN